MAGPPAPRPRQRYTVAVDCDGVLHSYTTPWLAHHVLPDPPVDGAVEWLQELAEAFEPVIFTTRGATEAGQRAVQEWLRDFGYEGPALRVTDRKPPALVYVDDRGWRFEGPGTFPSVEQLHRARPWHKVAR